MGSHIAEFGQNSLCERQWLSGKVMEGLKNGRKFGFPTINIALDGNCTVEDTGVFATEVIIGNERYKGMLYIGTRPTLGLLDKSLEINIFDFDKDCYDAEVKFKIGRKIRPEQKFASVEELISQLKKGRDEISQIFGN